MVIGERKPFDEIMKMLEGVKKIAVSGLRRMCDRMSHRGAG